MKQLFPTMYSRPKKGMLFAIVVYWFIGFVMVPMWMPFMAWGIWDNHKAVAWLEIGYHVMNCIAMAMMLKDCMEDGWFMMTTDKKSSLKHIGLTIGLILGALAVQIALLFAWGVDPGYSLQMLPVAEKGVALTSGYLVSLRPILGTASMVLCVPIAVCGLYYSLGFAPLCVKNKPVLAYLNVVLLTAIPAVIDILWRQQVKIIVIEYLVQLPAHLIACWSYQKTDNVWTPILSLAGVNLICALANIFLR